MLGPLPVRRYLGRLVLTDGHTRALALCIAGVRTVQIEYDDDPLDDAAYQECVRWCFRVGVHSVADLEGRIVDQPSYVRLWLERCREMHVALEYNR